MLAPRRPPPPADYSGAIPLHSKEMAYPSAKFYDLCRSAAYTLGLRCQLSKALFPTGAGTLITSRQTGVGHYHVGPPVNLCQLDRDFSYEGLRVVAHAHVG